MDKQRFLTLTRHHCRRRGQTLAQLADAIGYHPATLSKWGDIRLRIKPSTDALDGIAAALELDSFQHKELYDCFDYPYTQRRIVPDHYWGPAGPAPETFHDAAECLAIGQDQMLYLTDIRAFGGVVIGWVLGTAATATLEMKLSARIPPGTCIDYDPKLCEIHGELQWVAEFGDPVVSGRLTRSSAVSECEFRGPKVTVYWTPCDPNP